MPVDHMKDFHSTGWLTCCITCAQNVISLSSFVKKCQFIVHSHCQRNILMPVDHTSVLHEGLQPLRLVGLLFHLHLKNTVGSFVMNFESSHSSWKMGCLPAEPASTCTSWMCNSNTGIMLPFIHLDWLLCFFCRLCIGKISVSLFVTEDLEVSSLVQQAGQWIVGPFSGLDQSGLLSFFLLVHNATTFLFVRAVLLLCVQP